MRRKILSLVLALCMVLSLMPMTAFAAPGDTFHDVDGHWGQSAIERWSEYGVVNGDGTGGFAPDKQMTRAEFATMLANMLGYKEKAANTFADVNDSDWFADAILKLAAAGVMQGSNGMANPNAPITRQEAAVLMCRAFNIPTTGGNLDFADSADVADWAKGAVAALADRGMMNGVGNNNVAPLADINRASVATLLDNMITEYVTEDKTITGEVSGIVLVAADATVTVENATLNENLIVAPKADGAEVTLTGSTTASDVVVGATATVKVDSTASAGTVQVAAANSTVEVAGKADAVTVDSAANNTAVNVNEGAAVGDVALNAADTKVSVAENASVSNVAVSGSNANVEVSGKVDNVTVSSGATGTGITANSGATVGKVETSANDVTVSGSGKVENVTANDGTVSVTTPGTSVENKTDSADNVTNNGKPVEPSTGGETPTPPSSGGSSGGGSNPTTYAVTIESSVEHATVTASPTSAAAGATVTITITPESGYSIKASSVSVMGADNETVVKVSSEGGTYTFVMPAQAVTVTVTGTTEQDPVKDVTLQVVKNRGDVRALSEAVQKTLCLDDFLAQDDTATTDDMPWLVVTYNRVTKNAVTYEVYKDGIKLTETDGFTEGTSLAAANENACQSWSMKPVEGSSGTLWAKDTSVALSGKYKVVLKDGGKSVTSEEITYNHTGEKSYTVTFDSQGGSPVSSQTVLENGKLTKPTEPTKDGHTFGGWYTDSNCTDGQDWKFDNDTANKVTADDTLYAKWTPVDYTITVTTPTNGTVSAPANSSTAHFNDEIIITATPSENFVVDTITVTGAGDSTVAVTDNKFTMPASNVTVTVTFKSKAEAATPSVAVLGDIIDASFATGKPSEAFQHIQIEEIKNPDAKYNYYDHVYKVTGNIDYVTGWTGYSSSEADGYFTAIKFTNIPEGFKFFVGQEPTGVGERDANGANVALTNLAASTDGLKTADGVTTFTLDAGGQRALPVKIATAAEAPDAVSFLFLYGGVVANPAPTPDSGT